MKNIYLFATVCFTVYFQIMLRWRMSKIGQLPPDVMDKVALIIRSMFDPLVISAFVSALFAAICWMITVSKTELSTAYPLFLSLSFLFIVTLSIILLQETITLNKVVGVALILSGLVFVSRI